MSRIRRFDHLGITVADLDAVSGFFVQLGLEVEGRTFLEGDFLVSTVIGIPEAYRDRPAAGAQWRHRSRVGEVHPA
jgi:catechol 2,3-dioxygenase-like lactoylglutathione lyase family enzyme